jgi:hypothetical protein
MPDRSKGRGQTKRGLSSSRLMLGRGADREPWRRPRPTSIVAPVKMMMMMFDSALALVFNFKVETYGAPTYALNCGGRHKAPHS